MKPEGATETLQLIYRDEALVAINKPAGLLVHRSEIDRRETRFALQLVRDQIGQRVYPVHRLDKPTSGVLLFALAPMPANALVTAWLLLTSSPVYIAKWKVFCRPPRLLNSFFNRQAYLLGARKWQTPLVSPWA